MKVNQRGRITEFFEKPKAPADIERMRAPEEVLRRAGVAVERTVVMGADFFESGPDLDRARQATLPPVGIGPGSEVRNAIIDKNVRVGRGVRLVNRDGQTEASAENYVIVGGIIVVPKGAVIPDGSLI